LGSVEAAIRRLLSREAALRAVTADAAGVEANLCGSP
jgi:hypothetical protein